MTFYHKDGMVAEMWMREAIKIAKVALDKQEVPVGCVIVYYGKIIAQGYNEVNATKNSTRHAEMVAIDQLLEFSSIKSLSLLDVVKHSALYVTVEPCIMCAHALRLLGFAAVIFGCANQRFGGCGSVLNIHTIEQNIGNSKETLPRLSVVPNVLQKEAVTMLQAFYDGLNPNTL